MPERVERRLAEQADDRSVERRRRDEFRVPLGERWAGGWLCFETGGEKRRLAPYPLNWDELPVEELEALCGRATLARRPPRRLSE